MVKDASQMQQRPNRDLNTLTDILLMAHLFCYTPLMLDYYVNNDFLRKA